MLINDNGVDTYYYYLFNLQGDIVGIMDSSGNTVTEYTYDAWGTLLTTTGTLASTIGEKNPLRYRGYYYDSETGFYYLKSRYYDSVVQRFINADSLMAGVNTSVQGYNLFAYCFNNPVVLDDSNGNWPKIVKNTAKLVATKIHSLAMSIKSKTQTCNMGFSTSQSLNIQAKNISIGGAIGFSLHMNGDVFIQKEKYVFVSSSSSYGVSSQTCKSVDFVPNYESLHSDSLNASFNATMPIPNTPISGDGSIAYKQYFSDDGNEFYPSFSINAGAAFPACTNMELGVSVGYSASKSKRIINIYDVIDYTYNRIMEW